MIQLLVLSKASISEPTHTSERVRARENKLTHISHTGLGGKVEAEADADSLSSLCDDLRTTPIAHDGDFASCGSGTTLG